MRKECLNCGIEFEGSPQSRFHSDACRKAYSRRQGGQKDGAPSPESGHGEVLAETRTEVEEQEIRDRFGYATSETRTQAERQAVANRITGKTKSEMPSLEQYIATVIAEAAAYADSIGEDDKPVLLHGHTEPIANRRSDRIKRAERYARWRYEGYLTGEVASL
jgi:hypothetical protein